MVGSEHQNDGGEYPTVRCAQSNREDKTEASRRPVPVHPLVLNGLLNWRKKSPTATELDLLFPSTWLKCSKPLSPDSVLEKSIRASRIRAGIAGKQIGWHGFRQSLAPNLRALHIDIKVAQETLRHTSCRTTLDTYTVAVSLQKPDANLRTCLKTDAAS